MSTHNICFRGEIRKILCRYPLLSVAMIFTSHLRMLLIFGYPQNCPVKTDQTAWMRRLILVIAGCTYSLEGNAVSWLMLYMLTSKTELQC